MPENIFEKIKEEHVEFKDMVSQLEGGKSGKEDTFQNLKKELTAHIKAEEQTLYKSLKSDKKGKEMVLVGIEEHKMGSMVFQPLGLYNESLLTEELIASAPLKR